MNLGTATVIRGDARHLPLEDNTVDLIVTSPPYFALRSYQDDGEHYDGQIGSEPTPDEFIAAILEVTRECMRVLKPTGSLWVNLGDKYAANWNSGRATGGAGFKDEGRTRETRTMRGDDTPFRPKTLLGIPWRYALACIDELGLILRAEVIWSKPNGMPESVVDRVRRGHETWFHFTLEPRYYSALDEIREPHLDASLKRIAAGYNPIDRDSVETERNGVMRARGAGETTEGYTPNPLGKLPGSVWTIPTEPLKVPAELEVDHFAAFPTEWPKRIIKGWSPTGVCTACGEGRRPAVDHTRTFDGEPLEAAEVYGDGPTSFWDDGRTTNKGVGNWRFGSERTIVGYVCACNEPIASPAGTSTAADPSLETGRGGFNRPRSEDAGTRVVTRWEQRHEADQLRALPHRIRCVLEAQAGKQAFAHYIRTDRTGARPIPEHLRQRWRFEGHLRDVPAYMPAPTTPAVVLDPFGGTGTTAMVARALGRDGITVDLSGDYCRIAQWRTTDRDQLAKVLDIGKADPHTAGAVDTHDSLLDLLSEETP